jgi:phosphopantothenoylcysteine decarboxylase/phosphopantothenate--cysteine ligase
MNPKNLVLGVSGGIAVYKVPELISRLRKKGLNIDVMMTRAATEFVTPLTFREISQNPVHVNMFTENIQWNVEHIALAQKAAVMAIIPATANIIGKIASGIADDMVTSTIMAARCPKLIAPAMNSGMYENPATQRNLKILASDGYTIVGPDTGHLLCGDEGIGRLAPLAEIEVFIEKLLSPQDLDNDTILITSGGTREPLDPVRFIGNHSSGKMGHSLAAAAFKRGAKVLLVTAAAGAPRYGDVEVYPVNTTVEMREKVLELAPRATWIIKAAAPADYRPIHAATEKIKKDHADLQLSLTLNPDILLELGRNKKPDQTLIGFAAETNGLYEHAKEKLTRKNLDLIIGNLVAEGMGTDHNQVTIFSMTETIGLPQMSKELLADKLLSYIKRYRADGRLTE